MNTTRRHRPKTWTVPDPGHARWSRPAPAAPDVFPWMISRVAVPFTITFADRFRLSNLLTKIAGDTVSARPAGSISNPRT